jgi:hypothetical protein
VKKARKAWRKPDSRTLLAWFFLAGWICVLMQGALRKWIFPGAAKPLYLIQDVPLLLAYVYAVLKGHIWAGKVAFSCCVISLLLAIQTLAQLMFVDLPLKTAVIGLHQYIYYLPILFIYPVCLNHKEIRRFIRWNLLIIIPMGILGTMQSRAGKAAWINRTAAGDETAFSIAGSTAIRATGTFNFTLSYSIWCGVAAALVVGEWILPPEKRSFKSRLLLILFSICVAMATMVSGSRTAIFLAAGAFFGGLVAALLLRNQQLILRFGGIILAMPLMAGLAFLLAPDAFTGNLNRFSHSENQVEMSVRIAQMTVGFLSEPGFSVFGKGIGTGIQAASASSTDPYSIKLSEWDNIRGVQEMGTFGGIPLVLARYIASLLLIGAAVRAQLQRPGFAYALPIAFTVAPTLAIGDIWRTAPMVATQVFYFMALICGAILFRRESQSIALLNRAG